MFSSTISKNAFYIKSCTKETLEVSSKLRSQLSLFVVKATSNRTLKCFAVIGMDIGMDLFLSRKKNSQRDVWASLFALN